jgi:hypothetical protein
MTEEYNWNGDTIIIPRRNRLDLSIRPELAIRAAMAAVEGMHADVRLTEAVTRLQQALTLVADVVDDDLASPEPAYMTPEILRERTRAKPAPAEHEPGCASQVTAACDCRTC